MNIYIAKEINNKERRVPFIPEHVKKLADLGAKITIEPGLGATLSYSDELYKEAGAELSDTVGQADMVLRLNEPSVEQINQLKNGAIHVSYLDPFFKPELYKAMAEKGVTGISMEMIPRSTIAQKMDALSSQANLGGYVSVILAAEELDKGLPMMMTPAGTLTPSRVFIIGAGVAGLQAIATAKRMGARVEAFDTRPVVEEQVQSLGAKFVKVDLGEMGQTDQGYAKALTEEQLAKQREAMAKACAQADVVITTAQLFGRKAPLIITEEILDQMKPGSVIIDMAVETGGNVAGSELDQVVNRNGVKIVGYGNLPGRVPAHSSQMYSSNLYNFIAHFWDKENATFKLDLEDEIILSAMITHAGTVAHERFKEEG